MTRKWPTSKLLLVLQWRTQAGEFFFFNFFLKLTNVCSVYIFAIYKIGDGRGAATKTGPNDAVWAITESFFI
jgi:hypothetical protein